MRRYLFLVIPLLAIAQEPEIPPPTFPIKLRAPENAMWSIDIQKKGRDTASQSEASGGSEPAGSHQVSITKTGPIYLEKAAVKGGRGWEKWVFLLDDTFRLIRYSGDSKWARLWDARYVDISRYDKSDFEILEWIDKSNYVGVEKVNEQPAYKFEVRGNTPMTEMDRASMEIVEGEEITQRFDYTAWLDARTLLPLKLETSSESRTYTYGAAPSGKLSPPVDVISELKSWIEYSQKINR